MPDQVVGVSQIEGDVDASMTCEDGEVQPSDRKEPVAACPTGEIQPFDMWSGKVGCCDIVHVLQKAFLHMKL